MSRRSRFLVLALVAVILTSGCVVKRETKLSRQKTEGFVREQLSPRPDSVTCPDVEKIQNGAAFDCNVQYADGRSGTLTLHMIDDEGGVRFGPEDLRIRP